MRDGNPINTLCCCYCCNSSANADLLLQVLGTLISAAIICYYNRLSSTLDWFLQEKPFGENQRRPKKEQEPQRQSSKPQKVVATTFSPFLKNP